MICRKKRKTQFYKNIIFIAIIFYIEGYKFTSIFYFWLLSDKIGSKLTLSASRPLHIRLFHFFQGAVNNWNIKIWRFPNYLSNFTEWMIFVKMTTSNINKSHEHEQTVSIYRPIGVNRSDLQLTRKPRMQQVPCVFGSSSPMFHENSSFLWHLYMPPLM